eukprot:TRINITY_DN7861_c0_g1_i1.p1 TRINITY_DN7861_c0_g1~~TRINITY_DN7861_c0_g1_i1.p1  ORF type:complete len:325 (+),score=109.77 TRINITY_DN7861_c0_g1_i1:75-1049(+)
MRGPRRLLFRAGAAQRARCSSAAAFERAEATLAQCREELVEQREVCAELRQEIASLREAHGESAEVLAEMRGMLCRLSDSTYANGAASTSDPAPSDLCRAADDPVWPTVRVADAQPRQYRELSNEALATLAAQGQRGMHAAHRERLIREIMRVDRVSWGSAMERLNEMDQQNEKIYWLMTGPHRIGISLGVGLGFASVPMVFSKPVAMFFATHFVQLPEDEWPEGLDEFTCFQVGTWTWDWMEPLLGTASFVLLAAQFVRSNVKKMNTKPYTELVLSYRADRLSRIYPQYDRTIVRDWARYLPRVGLWFFPEFERDDSRPFLGI